MLIRCVQVTKYTHYMPKHWAGRCQTEQVRKYANLVLWCSAISVSIDVLPYILNTMAPTVLYVLRLVYQLMCFRTY